MGLQHRSKRSSASRRFGCLNAQGKPQVAARHRIVVHENGAPMSLGGCTDMSTALDVARKMAEVDGRVVLIQNL